MSTNPFTRSSQGIALALAISIGSVAFPARSSAEDCWINVTPPQECNQFDFKVLQFKNSCPGGQRTITACVTILTGPIAGTRFPMARQAGYDEIAEFSIGKVCAWDIKYDWRADGSAPPCERRGSR